MNFRNIIDAAVVSCRNTAHWRKSVRKFGAVGLFETVAVLDQIFARLSNGLVPADDLQVVKVSHVEDRAEVHVPVGPLHDVGKSGRIGQQLIVTGQA